jgi:hypothetical protein
MINSDHVGKHAEEEKVPTWSVRRSGQPQARSTQYCGLGKIGRPVALAKAIPATVAAAFQRRTESQSYDCNGHNNRPSPSPPAQVEEPNGAPGCTRD